MDFKNLEWLIKFNVHTWGIEQLEKDGYKVLRVEGDWIVCTIE